MSIPGIILLILVCILAVVIALSVLLVLSTITFIFKYKNNFSLRVKLWFLNLDITKILSRPKKEKTPKILHFSGESFGKIYETKSPKTNKKANRSVQAENHPALSQKQNKKSVFEVLDLLRELISDASEPFGKCAHLKVKKLHITAASENPDTTAIMFGHLNTAAGAVMLVAQKFEKLDVCNGAIGVYSDFLATKPSLDADIELKVKTRYAILTAYKILKNYLKNK